MMGPLLVTIGMLLIICGILLIFLVGPFWAGRDKARGGQIPHPDNKDNCSDGLHTGNRQEGPGTELRGGGIIMLGPIPIILGSDSKSALYLVLLVIILMVLMVLYFLIFM